MDARPWETLAEEPALDEPWYRVRRETVRLPSGRVLDDYYVAVRPDVATVVPVTAAGELVLVHQWKQGIRAVMLEVPSGLVDEGEEPAAAAARELREETGYEAELEPLGVWATDPSKATNREHVFLGREARLAHAPEPDENEAIEVVLLRPAEALAALDDGRIRAVPTVAALLAALRRLVPR